MRFNTNVQNICKLQPFTNKLEINNMRKFLLLGLIISLFSCEKNETDDLLPTVPVDVTIDLIFPQYSDLNTPSNWAYTTGDYNGIQGIIIQNTGIGNPPYKAFERACPNNDCGIPMTYDEFSNLICSCDKSEYSILLGGSPQTAGNSHFAREYKVVIIKSTYPQILNITNY